MSVRSEIEETLYRVALGFDENDIDMVIDCFTQDATLSLTPGEEVNGRNALRSFYEKRRAEYTLRNEQPRHVITNVIIEDEADGEVRVSSYLTRWVTQGGTSASGLSGRYRDRMINDSGRWRIKHHQIHTDWDEPVNPQ